MENNTFPKVAVGVCTYNRSNDLKRLLNSLKKLNYPNFEIIVVDNNSNDDTEQVAKSFSNVKYVREERQGLAYARNKLLDTCDESIEFLGILDDDETVNPDWIEKMLECFNLDQRVIAVGGPYLPVFPKVPPDWMPVDFHSHNVDVKGCNFYDNIGIAGGNGMVKMKNIRMRNVRFNTNLGYNGGVLLSGEDNEFYDKLVQDGELRGFTEFAPVMHHIPANKMTFKWFFKRYFFEGITQYYRFGSKVYLKNLLQLPVRIIRFLITLLTFNKKKIVKRFFKVVSNLGVVLAPGIVVLKIKS